MDTWVVATEYGLLDNEEKEAIRKAFKKQGVLGNVLVMNEEFEFIK